MYLVGAALYRADEQVAAWVSARLPGRPTFRDFGAIGIVHRGQLVGGVVFTSFRNGVDIEVNGAVAPGFRCSPATLRQILRYPFEQLGCVRISITTGRRNKRARAFAERLGFRVEGVRRKGLDGRQDAILYGLLRQECRLLTPKGS